MGSKGKRRVGRPGLFILTISCFYSPPICLILFLHTFICTSDRPPPLRSTSFASVYPLDVPTNDPSKDGIYISPSYDATSHFETVCDDVKRLYEQVMGKPLDFTGKIKRADGEEEEAQLNEAQ